MHASYATSFTEPCVCARAVPLLCIFSIDLLTLNNSRLEGVNQLHRAQYNAANCYEYYTACMSFRLLYIQL